MKKNLIIFTLFTSILSFSQANVEWTGAGADNNWSTTGNWSGNSLPSDGDNVYSLFDDHTIVIDQNVDLNRISNISGTINLVINAGKSLKVDIYAHTETGTITLNSDSDEFASFLSGNSVNNTLIYNRWVNSVSNGSTGWDLVGSPASGATISSVVGDSDLATNGSSPTTYALGSFDNSNLSWTNINENDTSGTLTSGKGYQMATTSGGNITFQGSRLQL